MSTTSRLLVFLWVCFFVLYFFDPTGKKNELPVERQLEVHEHEAMVLANMTFALNKTSMSPTFTQWLDTHVYALPPSPASQPVFYSNVTGRFQGRWKSVTLAENISVLLGQQPHSPASPSPSPSSTPPQAQLPTKAVESATSVASMLGGMNLAKDGSFRLRLLANATSSPNISYMEGRLDLEDGSSSFESLVHGLHFISEGMLFLQSSPDETDLYLYDLPKMMLEQDKFDSAVKTLWQANQDYIERLRIQLQENGKSSQEVEPSTSKVKCKFWIYMQLHPLKATREQLRSLERELLLKEGQSTIFPPKQFANMSLVSPNCQALLYTGRIQGRKLDLFLNKSRNMGACLALVTLVELFLTAKQMQRAISQSALTKISYITIALSCMLDMYMCMVLLISAIMKPALFLPYATAAFLKFSLFSVFGIRQLFNVIMARRRSTFNSETILRFRLYAGLLIGLGVFYRFASRSPTMIVLGTFVLHSFWIPQIISNIQRNTRRVFDRSYIIGMSVTRLLVPLYVLACPVSILDLNDPPRTGTAIALTVYVALQAIVLMLQETLGPRRFVPPQWIPPSYDYHPVLLSPDEESMAAQGETAETAEVLYPPPQHSVSGGSHLNSEAASGAGAGDASGSTRVAGSAVTSATPGPSQTARQRLAGRGSLISASRPSNNECAICFMPVRPARPPTPHTAVSASPSVSIPGQPSRTAGRQAPGLSSASSALASSADLLLATDRLNYMVTPCHHIFHTECLERWMEIKLECPVCRAELPPA
ncbi:hypothetical protein BC831DRAFT_425303 [Entophlyctis helioformis]|nr:hypothetical protein BC831DRAFT_425303 [Entophlyctis helioformis]